MSHEQPEDRRARRLAEVRAQRGSEERARQIAELEAEKAKPKVRTRSATPSVRKSPETSATFFGYPWAEWFEMRDAGRARLNTCAADRELISYGDLWAAIADTVGRELGSPHLALPRLLRDIGDVAMKDGEPNPMALAVQSAGDQDPGAGFFRAAVALHELPAVDEPPTGEDWTMTDGQRTFWRTQVEGLYAHFADD
ncbi:MAG TPA: hypothetical protein VIT24_13420 [Acidimicrobiales bacterium]